MRSNWTEISKKQLANYHCVVVVGGGGVFCFVLICASTNFWSFSLKCSPFACFASSLLH